MDVRASLALATSNARKVVGAFRARGAVSGSKAERLTELRLNHSAALRELLQARIIRKAGADRFYLDEAVWAQRRRIQGRTLAWIVGPMAALVAAFLLWR